MNAIQWVIILSLVALAAAYAEAAKTYPPFTRAVEETGGTITLHADDPLPVSHDEVTQWVTRAAEAITHFYGRYPVRHVDIYVHRGGSAVNRGVEHDGRRIDIHLGSDTTVNDLTDDWMITHEMFHLSQPDLEDENNWMSEGMADYLEPVARVRLGQISAERFWRDLVEGMPNGLPQAGDRGLNHTHTWGRTYWGGSMYWLLADIRVRERTHNKKSVRDAARGVLDSGGDGGATWSLKELVAAYDRATGTNVFSQLNEELGEKPGKVDLDALWKSLGVVYQDGKVTFDDSARLAAVRRGITEREK
jgi:predicted metalloprotease with PDZ domain